MNAFEVSEEDHGPWPLKDSLLLAVRTTNQMFIQTKLNSVNFRHTSFPMRIENYDEPDGFAGKSARSTARYSQAARLSVRCMTDQGTLARTVAMQPLFCFAPPFPNLAVHDGIAFTGCLFQSRPVDNMDFAAGVGDESCFLQDSRGHSHAGAACSQHLRN